MCATALLRGGSPHVERARPARMVEDVDPHRLGSHRKCGQGRRSVQRRSCIEPRPEPRLGRTTIWGPPCCGGCCGGAAGAARAASAAGAAGGATPAGCSECRACPTPHPKCCPISRSVVDSLHPDRPTAAKRATVVRPSPGRRTFFPAIDGSRTLARGPQNVLPVPPWSSPHGGHVGSLPDHDGGLHQRTVLHRHRPMHRRSRRPKLHSLAQPSGELPRQPNVLHHADFARHRK